MTDRPFGSFFLPGPTEVRPAVLAAMQQPMIAHRGDAFRALFAEMQPTLRALFGTTRPVYLAASSGTGMMEAALRNAPTGPVLALVNGAFSARFADIARACDRSVRVLEVPAGQAVTAEQLDAALIGSWYAAVTVVHSETSTGALTDVAALAPVARAQGAMLLVDSVTGVGGVPMQVDAWGLDFTLTGSQKALALPAGLGLAVASERYLLQADALPDRGRYFDVVEFERSALHHETPNTPALSLLYALHQQLRDIAAEGIDARCARHLRMQAQMLAWAEAAAADGLLDGDDGIVAVPGARSPTVTALRLRAGMRDADIDRAMSARGFTIGRGYGALAGHTVRIGHMGDHTEAGLARCLEALREALHEVLQERRELA